MHVWFIILSLYKFYSLHFYDFTVYMRVYTTIPGKLIWLYIMLGFKTDIRIKNSILNFYKYKVLFTISFSIFDM